MNNIHHHHLKAPTVITTLKLGAPIELREQWAKEAYNLNYFSYQTNLYSQMSSYHVWAETKVYDELIDKIQIALNEGHGKEGGKYDNSGYRIEEAWTAVYKEGDYAMGHSHIAYRLAWCYYIKTGEYPTPLVFDELDYEVRPEDDMLIIFDASLWHSVPKHRGDDRIVLAGNCSIASLDQLDLPRFYPPLDKK